jgi:VCBS repeat protein/peptidase C13-like protein
MLIKNRNFIFYILLLFFVSSVGFSREIIWPRINEGMYENQNSVIYAGAADFTVPELADIDGDGDLDLFIGRSNGYPSFFRNNGTKSSPIWTLDSQSYNMPSLSSYPSRTAPLLQDIDRDGDLDLLLGIANGCIAFYRNIGDSFTPSWNLETEDWTLQAGSGNSRPALMDVDDDGDFDLFIGNSNGQISFYRNDAAPGADPLWNGQSDNYMNIDVGSDASPYFSDINGDALMDLLIGDASGNIHYYKAYGIPSLVFYTLISSNYNGISLPGNTAPCLKDIDDNGTLDFFIGSFSGSLEFYRNTGSVAFPVWDSDTSLWRGLDVGSESSPDFADLDNDGDLDMIIASFNKGFFNNSGIRLFWNNGSPRLPDWVLADCNFAGNSSLNAAPRLVDIDNDGDQDLFVGDMTGNINYYRNDGTGELYNFVRDVSGDINAPGSDIKPAFEDIDNDGDFDLFVAFMNTSGDGSLYYYQNTGSAIFLQWALPVDCSSFFSFGNLPAIDIEDLDLDGFPDLLCSYGNGVVKLFKGNSGTAPFAFDKPPLSFDVGELESGTVPAIADLNGDLHPDILLGGTMGGLRYFRNPSENILVDPSFKTLFTGEEIVFQADSASTGSWHILSDKSGGVIDPVTGIYTAGSLSGVDIIQFDDEITSWGLSYVNVITPDQGCAIGKSVIMAGKKGLDPLWETTNKLANNIFRTLLFQGFSRENIMYLNPDTAQDVDGNGNSSDDIDAESTLDNIETALTNFSENCSKLFIYLIDHGDASNDGSRGFITCNKTENFYAYKLDELLDDLQEKNNVTTITLVVDCCMSGAFIKECSGAPEGKFRMVLSSAGVSEPAFFCSGGLISFTSTFLSSINTGLSVGEAFNKARSVMSRYQDSCIDDNGDGVFCVEKDGGIANNFYIGPSFIEGRDRPQIAKVSPNTSLSGGNTEVLLWASGVSSPYPVTNVHASVVSPGVISKAPLYSNEPVIDLIELELIWNPEMSRYETSADIFTVPGSYVVSIYAEDIWGGLSDPKILYVNQSEMEEKVIIFCGDGNYDSTSPWSSSISMADSFYNTLKARWISDDNIIYLASGSSRGIDDLPTRSNLTDAVNNSAGISKLTLYITGKGHSDYFDIDGDGQDADDLLPGELNTLLDSAQSHSDTREIVILDFIASGSWLEPLKAQDGKERIVITSCGPGENSWCGEGGMVSFTQYLSNRIFNGRNLRDSFNWSRAAVRAFSGRNQNPQLDDNSSGSSDYLDGTLSMKTWIGPAFITGSPLPVIGDYEKDLRFDSDKILLWASDVWDADGISEVFAHIIRPDVSLINSSIDVIDLEYNDMRGRWEKYYSFPEAYGTFSVIYYATDKKGDVSDPCPAYLDFGDHRDIYDLFYRDNYSTTTLNFISHTYSQTHNFWNRGDVDWALFIAESGKAYNISISDQAPDCNAAISLYLKSDLNNPILVQDDWGPGGSDEIISWQPHPENNVVYVKVTQGKDTPDLYGGATTYTLRIHGEWGDHAGLPTITEMFSEIGPSGGELVPGICSICINSKMIVPPEALSEDIKFLWASYHIHPTDEELIYENKIRDEWKSFTQHWYNQKENPERINSSIVWIGRRDNASISFNKPTTITLQFIDDYLYPKDYPWPVHEDTQSVIIDDIPEGVNPADMRIYWWKDNKWELLPGIQTVNEKNYTVSASILDFGEAYFAVAPREKPDPVILGWFFY